jgi:hypothetical protein
MAQRLLRALLCRLYDAIGRGDGALPSLQG